MSDNTTGERVRKLVADHLGVEMEKATNDASLIDDLGADSLDAVELCMAVEEEFGIAVSDDEADKWHTVGDIVTTAVNGGNNGR